MGSLLPVSPKGKTGAVIDSKSLADYRERRRKGISVNSAASLSGMAPWLLAGLHKIEFLRAETGPKSDGSTEITVHPTSVSALLANLQKASVQRDSDMVTLESLSQEEAIDAIASAAAGKRRAHIVITSRRISSIYVTPDPYPHSGRGDVADTQDHLPIRAAAKKLGVPQHVVEHLASAGLLEQIGGAFSGIPQFLENYMWAADAAIRLGIDRRHLSKWVKRGRLHPVLSLGFFHLYRVEEVEKYASENICSVRDIAAQLGVSGPYVHRLIHAGTLTAVSGPGVDGYRNYIIKPPSPQELVALTLASRQMTTTMWSRSWNEGCQSCQLAQGPALADNSTHRRQAPLAPGVDPRSDPATHDHVHRRWLADGDLVNSRQAADILAVANSNFDGVVTPIKVMGARLTYYQRSEVLAVKRMRQHTMTSSEVAA